MDKLIEMAQGYINIPYMFSFLLLSYGIKEYLGVWLDKITKTKWKTVYTVLIIAAIVALPFYFFIGAGLDNIIFSYTLGTTLHETAFWWIEKKIKPKKDVQST